MSALECPIHLVLSRCQGPVDHALLYECQHPASSRPRRSRASRGGRAAFTTRAGCRQRRDATMKAAGNEATSVSRCEHHQDLNHVSMMLSSLFSNCYPPNHTQPFILCLLFGGLFLGGWGACSNRRDLKSTPRLAFPNNGFSKSSSQLLRAGKNRKKLLSSGVVESQADSSKTRKATGQEWPKRETNRSRDEGKGCPRQSDDAHII